MTGNDEASGDRELRALLEKIAATAGDPPAHGLVNVAMLRRRRKRHRRGAVAAAMALAVSAVGGGAWLSIPRDNGTDVSAASQTDGDVSSAEVPDVLEVRCSPEGIDVPVASIRPQSDGLHITVFNQSDGDANFRVTSRSAKWDSGLVPLAPGQSDLRQPVAPGVLTVGCQVDGTEERRQVNLVDEDRLYTPPELACPGEERDSELPEDVEVDPPTDSYSEAVLVALEDVVDEADEVDPLDGYPDQEFDDPTTTPMVRVVRDGDTVAFVALKPGGVEGPWSAVTVTEACEGFLPPEEEEGSSTSDEDSNRADETPGTSDSDEVGAGAAGPVAAGV